MNDNPTLFVILGQIYICLILTAEIVLFTSLQNCNASGGNYTIYYKDFIDGVYDVHQITTNDNL